VDPRSRHRPRAGPKKLAAEGRAEIVRGPMRCPSCNIEIGPGEDTCSGCGAATGAARQESGREESLELVCVLRTTDSLHLLLAKSVLDAAGIPLVVQGEQGLALFPVGPLGSRVTKRALGASILVPRGRAAEARELLETPAEPPSDSDWNTDHE